MVVTEDFLAFSKARGNVFLDRVAELLAAQGVTVNRYRKPTSPQNTPKTLVAI